MLLAPGSRLLALLKLFKSWLVKSGVLIALGGIGVDYLLPGARPGVDLPQLLVVAAGLTMMIVGARTQSDRVQGAAKGRLRRAVAAALLVALATLIAIEIVLTARGVPLYFPADPADTGLKERPWWTCGAAGCHYVHEAVQAACATGELRDRVCGVNAQGYADAEDFKLPPDWEDRRRILLLGDSFTWGASADEGKSYAEFLEAAFPQALIWNTGIPGTGTNQALLVFDEYAPALRPQLTILGLVNNDIDDNLLPIDSWVNALDAKGQAFHVRKYAIDDDENVIAFDLDTLGYIRAHGKAPPSSESERLLGATRLGTLLLRLRDMSGPAEPGAATYERRRQVTRRYLQELKLAVSASGSELLVIMIPYSEDIERLGPRLEIAKALMREVEIPYLNPVGILDPAADYGLPLDDHWTNSGHQKVGALLSDCVQRYFASGGFADCPHIALP